jgi:hypothetical protein
VIGGRNHPRRVTRESWPARSVILHAQARASRREVTFYSPISFKDVIVAEIGGFKKISYKPTDWRVVYPRYLFIWTSGSRSLYLTRSLGIWL